MAIGSCRECDHQVSSEADNCPSCGCPSPYPKDSQEAQPEVVTAQIVDEQHEANSNSPSPAEPNTTPDSNNEIVRSDGWEALFGFVAYGGGAALVIFVFYYNFKWTWRLGAVSLPVLTYLFFMCLNRCMNSLQHLLANPQAKKKKQN